MDRILLGKYRLDTVGRLLCSHSNSLCTFTVALNTVLYQCYFSSCLMWVINSSRAAIICSLSLCSQYLQCLLGSRCTYNIW